MNIGQIVVEEKNGKRARVLMKHQDWQLMIEYIDDENKSIHPNAIAWFHSRLVKAED